MSTPTRSVVRRGAGAGHGDWVPLSQHTTLINRQWKVVLACVTLGLIAGGVDLSTTPEQYVARASVLVSEGEPGGPSLDTEIQLVRSDEVAQQVRTALGDSSSPRELSERISVTVPANTRIMRIDFTAQDALSAQQGADAAARGYLELRRSLADDARDDRVDQMEARLDDVASQRAVSEAAALDVTTSASRRSVAAQRSAALASQLDQLEVRIARLLAQETVPGDVVQPAELPRAPEGDDPTVSLTSGGLLGLLAGLGLALLARRRRRGIDPTDLERELGLPVLSEVHRHAGALSAAGLASSRTGVRRLRNHLLLTAAERDVVLVTSTISGTTATDVATALAASLGRSGSETAMVQLGHPVSGRDPGPGRAAAPDLHRALARDGDLDDAILRRPDTPGLALMSLGGSPDAGAWLEPQAVRYVVRQLRATFMTTVLTGPMQTGDAALVLCPHVDSVILVVSDRTPVHAVADAVETLRLAGGRPTALVLAHSGRSRSRR